jgi:hypothetical protein
MGTEALWCVVHSSGTVDYIPVIEVLLGAGAKVSQGTLAWVNEQGRLPAEQKQRIVALLTR